MTTIIKLNSACVYIIIYIYTACMTCSNEISRLSKKIKIELVTPLERRCINLSNSVKNMDISRTQPKLLDAENAWGRKFKTEKMHLQFTVA